MGVQAVPAFFRLVRRSFLLFVADGNHTMHFTSKSVESKFLKNDTTSNFLEDYSSQACNNVKRVDNCSGCFRQGLRGFEFQLQRVLVRNDGIALTGIATVGATYHDDF